MTRLLLIDDEERFARALAVSLRARGYDVEVSATGEDGLEAAARLHPDATVLDLGLPGMSGLDVLRKLREWNTAPVIVLSARHEEATKVQALDIGADDYVTKPFGMDELLARLRAALRRGAATGPDSIVTTDDFTIDTAATRVTTTAGDDVHLTKTEWKLLEVLVKNRGKLVSQRRLLHEVWGPGYDDETEYLRVYMAALRRKLEPEPSRPRYLRTETGMGYRFDA
ncbi:MAG: response regulator [Actinobacteria bacterium]|nr:response regulator [Actinomycetota bacterium]MBV9663700.1 response regulator [Actinomycetota bacterium]MBV9936452.1 response regulator [Actinomycetota bacterium]